MRSEEALRGRRMSVFRGPQESSGRNRHSHSASKVPGWEMGHVLGPPQADVRKSAAWPQLRESQLALLVSEPGDSQSWKGWETSAPNTVGVWYRVNLANNTMCRFLSVQGSEFWHMQPPPQSRYRTFLPSTRSSLIPSFQSTLPTSPPGNHCSDFYHSRSVSSVLELHLNGIIQYVLFCIWLFT